MLQRAVVFASVLLLVAGCRKKDDDPPPAVDAGGEVDTGSPPVDAGSDAGGRDASAGLTADEEAAIEALVAAAGAATALGGPLVAEGEMLRDDSRLDTAGERTTTVREHVESAVAGNSIVTDPTCVTFAWSGLMATITFTGCIAELTMQPLDGSITFATELFPLRFTLTFTALTLGTLSLDGDVTLLLGGACREADPDCVQCADGDTECQQMQTNQRTLTADLTLSLGTDFTIGLEEFTLTVDATGASVSGTGTITSPTASFDFVVTTLFWAMGDCLPSSGTVVLTPPSGPAITAEAVATTPDDGNVMVTIPPLPPFPYMIAAGCGSSM